MHKDLAQFLDLIKATFNKRKRSLKIFAFIIGLIITFASISFFSNSPTLLSSQVYSYLFIILSVIFMFAIGFHSLNKKSRVQDREDFQWFINNPQNVKSYQIIGGTESKIILTGSNQKCIIPINLSLYEVEKSLFQAFPHLNPKKESESNNENNTPPPLLLEETTVEKSLLLDNIPNELKKYFIAEKHYYQEYIRTKKTSIIISLVLFIICFLSGLSFFTGYPDFFIFGYKNIAFYLLIWVGLLVILYRYEDYTLTKQWLKYFQIEPSKIVWIYISESKNSVNYIPLGKSYGLYFASNDGKKLHIPIASDNINQVYLWASLYFDYATLGYLHQYEDLFKNNPKNFSEKTKNKKD